MHLDKKYKLLSSLMVMFMITGMFAPILNVVNTSFVYANSTSNTTKTLKYNYSEKTIALRKNFKYCT